MFEYLYFREIGAFVMLWLAIVLLLASLDYTLGKIMKYAFGTVFVLAVILNFYLSFVFDENVELFKNDKKLECKVDKNKYLVEKSDGTVIKKDYFVKDNLLILIVDCEEF